MIRQHFLPNSNKAVRIRALRPNKKKGKYMNKKIILKALAGLALEQQRFSEQLKALQTLVEQEEKEEQARGVANISSNDIMTIDDASDLLNLSKSRIYALCSHRDIPHYKQGKLYFKRKEIEAWMTAKRVSTRAETESKAAIYCHTH